PIAKIAAKLALGFNLDELKNPIIQDTSAYFEPALDYVILKMPRWNFDKFKGADDTLGFQMKSVGEVMAIGRTFPEALQKACQSLENNATGLSFISTSRLKPEELIDTLKRPTWDRIFRIKEAMAAGVSIKTIHDLTQIDRWFLYQIQDIVNLENELKKAKHLEKISPALM